MIKIIERYKPEVYIIENPLSSKIWKYIENVLGFMLLFDNPVLYSNYDNYPISKPTKFSSNIPLYLNYNKRRANAIEWNKTKGYNNRSNIPISLVKEIFDRVVEYFEQRKDIRI